jgi:hypothetical protein
VVRDSNSHTHVRRDIDLILSRACSYVNRTSDVAIMEVYRKVWYVEPYFG